jgi:hypothetical protein
VERLGGSTCSKLHRFCSPVVGTFAFQQSPELLELVLLLVWM